MKIFLKTFWFILIMIFFNLNLLNSAVHIGTGYNYKNIGQVFNDVNFTKQDTIFLHQGTYEGYQGIIGKVASDKSVYIMPYQNENVIISGCWQFQSCGNIQFKNLIFKANEKNTGRFINVDNNGDVNKFSYNIVFDSCSFSGVTDKNSICAVKFGGVNNFNVTNCHFYDLTVCDAIDFNVCNYGVMHNNVFENCLSAGHIKGGSKNIYIYRNLFKNSSMEPFVVFEMGGDTGDQFYNPIDSSEIQNCSFNANIVVGGYRGVALSSARWCDVANNTFYNCGQMTLRLLGTSHKFPELKGNNIFNNIFAFASSGYINGSAQAKDAATFRDNLYYSISIPDYKGPYWDTPALDNVKEINPRIYGAKTLIFVNPNNNDFHLCENSPAIGGGKYNNINDDVNKYDFYGNQFKSPCSIGAIEYDVVNSINETDLVDLIISPNPASDYIQISLSPAGGGRGWTLPTDVILSEAKNLVKIYNALGIEYTPPQTLPLEGRGLKIDVSNLPAGVYFIRIGDKFEKFVKY